MERMLDPYQINAAPGNRALVFLVNSADEAAYSTFVLGILPALNHFGIPYRLLDLSTSASLSDLAAESAGAVLAHDGVGAAMTSHQSKELADAVERGLGIASLDGRLSQSPPAVHDLFGAVDLRALEIAAITATNPRHYVTGMQEPGAMHSLRAPVCASIPGGLVPGFEAIAADPDGRPLVVAKNRGDSSQGRRVALLFSPTIWLREHFGHCMGLDDLFWRALVWIAAKPFATLAIPPFVTCRIDDASGSYDHFGYVSVLNEFNWVPSIGLFLEDIDEEDAKAIKDYHDAGTALFSAHAFHEIGPPAPDLIYIQHDGKEYPLPQVAEHFARLDRFYEKLDITPARTMNAHYSETGLNSLPFLAARNQRFTMGLIPYGVNWAADSWSWEPYPYGHQGFNYGPMAPDPRFWNALAHYTGGYKIPETHLPAGEFMNGKTVFGGESKRNDVPGMIAKAVKAIKIGLSSGFFGTLMTHEQRIASVSPSEWRAVISGIADGLSDRPVIYRNYDEIAQYTKDKARTRIAKTLFDAETENLIVDLEGICEAGLLVHIFQDHEDHCVCDLVDTPPFSGFYTFPE